MTIPQPPATAAPAPTDPHPRALALRDALAALHTDHPGGQCDHEASDQCSPAIFAAELHAAETEFTTYMHAVRWSLSGQDFWRGDYAALDTPDPAPYLREVLDGEPDAGKLIAAAAALASLAGYLEHALPDRIDTALADPADAHLLAIQLTHAEHSLTNFFVRLERWLKFLGDHSYDNRAYVSADPDGSLDQVQSSMRTAANIAAQVTDLHHTAAQDLAAIARQLTYTRRR